MEPIFVGEEAQLRARDQAAKTGRGRFELTEHVVAGTAGVHQLGLRARVRHGFQASAETQQHAPQRFTAGASGAAVQWIARATTSPAASRLQQTTEVILIRVMSSPF